MCIRDSYRAKAKATGSNDKRPMQRQCERQRGRQRLEGTSDPNTHQPAEAQHQRRLGDATEQPRHHVKLSAQDSLYPSSPPQTPIAKPLTSPAERPKSLNLQRTSSQPRPQPTADQPEIVPSTSGMADVGASRRLSPGGSDQTESNAAKRGWWQLKVSDIPGSEPRAERVNCQRQVSAAGQHQTPDSGVVVSPLEQCSAGVQSPSAINPELILQGVEYRIAQTPNKSTIVIIGGASSESSLPRAGSQPSQTATPSTPSPVRDDQMPVPVPPGIVQPVARTGPAISHQPVNVTTAASKFVVSDSTTTAVPVGPSYRPFPSTPNDERTRVRLNSGGSQPRYVVAAGALTTIEEPAAEKPVPPAGRAAFESEVPSTSPSNRRNDVELDVASRQAVINSPLVPPKAPAPPAGRITTSSKPKASTPVAKQRDAKSTAVAKPRQPTAAQKRAPVNGKGQSGQRSKQSQIIAKKSENRQQVPAKLTQSGHKRQDSGVTPTSSEESQSVKPSVAELRAKFQARCS